MNVLFTWELSRRLRAENAAITANCVQPGVVATDIWRRVPACLRCCLLRCMLSVDDGAEPVLQLCIRHDSGVQNATAVDGQYFDRFEQSQVGDAAANSKLAVQLWERSLELVHWSGEGSVGLPGESESHST